MPSSRVLSVLALIAATVAVVLALGRGASVLRAQEPDDGSQQEEEELSEALQKLMAQRLATLRSIEELLREQHEAGRSSVDAVLVAALDRVQAELALADSKDRRIELLREQLLQGRALEAASKKRFQAGTITEVQVLQAVAFRLELEIRLEREGR